MTAPPPKPSRKPVAVIGGAAVIAIAGVIVKPWEGNVDHGYLDVIGVPTACYGHTGKDVRVGQKYTADQCDAWLRKDMGHAYQAVSRCITAPLYPHEAAAFVSLAYNVGDDGVCGSTLQRMANAWNYAGACAQIKRYVYAKGRYVQGLANRRQAEYSMCMGNP